MKYEYKKGKFIKNGHTMFEEDVLNDLKRLAHLEEERLLPIQIQEGIPNTPVDIVDGVIVVKPIGNYIAPIKYITTIHSDGSFSINVDHNQE